MYQAVGHGLLNLVLHKDRNRIILERKRLSRQIWIEWSIVLWSNLKRHRLPIPFSGTAHLLVHLCLLHKTHDAERVHFKCGDKSY